MTQIPNGYYKNFLSSRNFLILLVMLFLVGHILISTTYYIAFNQKFFNSLFWISILFIEIPIFLILINNYINIKIKVFFLVLLQISIFIIRLLPSSSHFYFADEIIHYDSARLIYETGYINSSSAVSFEISTFYPGIEIITNSLNFFMNLTLFQTSRYLICITHAFLPIFIYLFFKTISNSDHIGIFGAFIYINCPVDIFFHNVYSYESIGIIFVAILMFLVSKMYLNKNYYFFICFLLILLALTITHHFSSYMLVFFMLILVLVGFISSYEKIVLNQALMALVITFGWMVYVANAAINYLSSILVSRVIKIFELSLFGGEKADLFSSSLSNSLLPISEYIIDTYIYTPVILFLCIMGVRLIWSKGSNVFSSSLIIYGPISFLFTLALIPTSGSELATRLWGFIYIGIAFAIGVVINKSFLENNNYNIKLYKTLNPYLIFFLVIIVIIGGISIGDKPIYREPTSLSPKLAGGFACMTTDVFYAADWFSSNFGINNIMRADQSSRWVFLYYGRQNISRLGAWRIFMPLNFDKEIKEYLYFNKINFIVIDERITKFLAEVNQIYFTNDEKNSPYAEFKYGVEKPLPRQCLDKFDNTSVLNNIFDNNNINIYITILS